MCAFFDLTHAAIHVHAFFHCWLFCYNEHMQLYGLYPHQESTTALIVTNMVPSFVPRDFHFVLVRLSPPRSLPFCLPFIAGLCTPCDWERGLLHIGLFSATHAGGLIMRIASVMVCSLEPRHFSGFPLVCLVSDDYIR